MHTAWTRPKPKSLLPALGNQNFDDASGFCKFAFRAIFDGGGVLERSCVNICEIATFTYEYLGTAPKEVGHALRSAPSALDAAEVLVSQDDSGTLGLPPLRLRPAPPADHGGTFSPAEIPRWCC